MGLVTGVAIYFVIWWITLFVVLPFGVEQNQNVKEGNDPGAPVQHRMLKKMAINTGLAFDLWSIIYIVDVYDIITIKDLVSIHSNSN